MHIKQVLATYAWNNNKQNNDENICLCVQGNTSDTGHTDIRKLLQYVLKYKQNTNFFELSSVNFFPVKVCILKAH